MGYLPNNVRADAQIESASTSANGRTLELFALADAIEARFQKAHAQIEKLTSSLLARAFSGKLVPPDPTDEPAGKLLEGAFGQQTANQVRD